MALLHRVTLSPTKAEIISDWLPAQPWAPGGDSSPEPASLELIGAYRFDDPEGRVGLEAHLLRSNDVLLHVPLVYRDAPLDGLDARLVGTIEHSVLGQRLVYDGLTDPVFIGMLAAATLTGTGQAIGMVDNVGRWTLVPTPVHLQGGGWFHGPVPVDGFSTVSDDDTLGDPAQRPARTARRSPSGRR